ILPIFEECEAVIDQASLFKLGCNVMLGAIKINIVKNYFEYSLAIEFFPSKAKIGSGFNFSIPFSSFILDLPDLLFIVYTNSSFARLQIPEPFITFPGSFQFICAS